MSEWRPQRPDNKTAAAQIIDCASAADLVIMAQERDATDRPYNEDTVCYTIRNCGRPVLVIPQDFRANTIGESILLGWSAIREATHAAHDILSIAASGALVRLLSAEQPPDDGTTAHDLVETYRRHGLLAEVIYRELGSKTVVETILREANLLGSDLIATGAFGHTCGHDKVIGATTTNLLRSATLPVLYSS